MDSQQAKVILFLSVMRFRWARKIPLRGNAHQAGKNQIISTWLLRMSNETLSKEPNSVTFGLNFSRLMGCTRRDSELGAWGPHVRVVIMSTGIYNRYIYQACTKTLGTSLKRLENIWQNESWTSGGIRKNYRPSLSELITFFLKIQFDPSDLDIFFELQRRCQLSGI